MTYDFYVYHARKYKLAKVDETRIVKKMMLIDMLLRHKDSLTLHQLAQLKSACITDRERAILLMLAGIGIRVNELIILRVEHIDFVYGQAKVGARKGVKSRICIIPMPVLKVISEHLRGRQIGYIFEGRQNGHLSARQVQRIVDKIAQRAGLQKENLVRQRNRKHITQQLLRYSAANWWLDCGVDIAEVAEQLGLRKLQINGKHNEERYDRRKTSFERDEIYKVLMFETRKRLNDISKDEDRFNDQGYLKNNGNAHFDSNNYILADLKNRWSKIVYEE